MKNLKNYLKYVKENINNDFDEDIEDIENFNDDIEYSADFDEDDNIEDFDDEDFKYKNDDNIEEVEDFGDDNNFSEPEQDDCIISDVVRGGYDVSCGGKFIGHFDDFDDALVSVNSWKEENNFFPNTWTISDHGNYTLIDDAGNEIK